MQLGLDLNTVLDLLKLKESNILDFKAQMYNLKNKRGEADLIKDLICMANTPRENSAYIIVGVKCLPNGDNSVEGFQVHPDDANIQNIIRHKIHPTPTIGYHPFDINGKLIGVFEISVDRNGPFGPAREYEELTLDRLWWRQNSKNTPATVSDQRKIHAWMRGESLVPKRTVASWDSVFQACNQFQRGRNYILVLPGGLVERPEVYSSLGRIPWSAVIDLESDVRAGIFGAVESEVAKQRRVHLLTVDNSAGSLNLETTTYWYAAAGLKERGSTLPEGSNHRDWNRKHGAKLTAFFEQLVRFSGTRPSTAVICSGQKDYVDTICMKLDEAFRDSLEFVYAVPQPETIDEVVEKYGGNSFSISLVEAAEGIRQSIPSADATTIEYRVPFLGGGTVALSTSDYLYLSEHMDVLCDGIDQFAEENSALESFLYGKQATWNDLAMRRDVDRNITTDLVRALEQDLGTRTPIRFNLFHSSGAGGSTVARRVAYDLHRRFPTVVLHKIDLADTVARLRTLFSLTKMPILAVIDGAEATANEVDKLYYQVRSQQVAVVFLCVFRDGDFKPGQDEQNQTQSGRRVHLSTMKNPERYLFRDRYGELRPTRKQALNDLVAKSNRYQIPFLYGLTALEAEYAGLDNYVRKRLIGLTNQEKAILTCLAIAYHYGQKPFPVNLFAQMLGLPESRSVVLEEWLSPSALQLLVEEENGFWRPLHALVAEEVLEQVLATGEDLRTWAYELPNAAERFIEICASTTHRPADAAVELVRRVFVVRESKDIMNGEPSNGFARIIHDIARDHSQLRILRKIVENFPDEPHFLAHLGRFLFSEMDRHDEALQHIDEALELSKQDHQLHHMRGMCLRSKLKWLLERNPSMSQTDIRVLVEEAADSFKEARALELNDEHGYVSHIQMLIRVIDHGFIESKAANRQEFLVAPEAGWYRELLDEAEDLLEGARARREGERESEYVARCLNDISKQYDNHSRVLEGWTNLLSRPGVYKPPIRREIVRAMLGKAQRNWDQVPKDHLKRMAEIMSENMREEPMEDRNVRLWFQAVRRLPGYSMDAILEKLSQMQARSNSVDAAYSLYVLYSLRTIQGHLSDRIRAVEALEACKDRAKRNRNRTFSFEWLGPGDKMNALVNHRRLKWDEKTDFWGNVDLLVPLQGTIKSLKGPEEGQIELACGLTAFFVPGKAKPEPGFQPGRHENVPVRFYLGFSYDGLRAWNVCAAQQGDLGKAP